MMLNTEFRTTKTTANLMKELTLTMPTIPYPMLSTKCIGIGMPYTIP